MPYEQVDAILSGVEPVLTVLSHHAEKIREQAGAICIVSSPECLAVGNDKLLTSHWLRDNRFSFPKTVDASDSGGLAALIRECGSHLIAKPRFGKGGHGVFELRNSEDVRWAAAKPDYVIQEYLGNTQQEYTAGCFSDHASVVRGALVMRRDLLEGTTYRAEAGAFPEVRHEAIRIAEALKPMGPSNIQLRVHGGRPVCFEINIRFSGTTPIRARLGFNDVEAALNHYVLGQSPADLPVITKGIALRYWNEAYVDTEAKARLDEFGKSDQPGPFNLAIEDYGFEK